jgi:hypothetical protein
VRACSSVGRELERRRLPRVAACTIGRALSAIGAGLGMPKREDALSACRIQRARDRRLPSGHRRDVVTPGQNQKRFVAGEHDGQRRLESSP